MAENSLSSPYIFLKVYTLIFFKLKNSLFSTFHHHSNQVSRIFFYKQLLLKAVLGSCCIYIVSAKIVMHKLPAKLEWKTYDLLKPNFLTYS